MCQVTLFQFTSQAPHSHNFIFFLYLSPCLSPTQKKSPPVTKMRIPYHWRTFCPVITPKSIHRIKSATSSMSYSKPRATTSTIWRRVFKTMAIWINMTSCPSRYAVKIRNNNCWAILKRSWICTRSKYCRWCWAINGIWRQCLMRWHHISM